MKKSLRALILTLGILVTTGISSAAYAQDCYTLTQLRQEIAYKAYVLSMELNFQRG